MMNPFDAVEQIEGLKFDTRHVQKSVGRMLGQLGQVINPIRLVSPLNSPLYCAVTSSLIKQLVVAAPSSFVEEVLSVVWVEDVFVFE